MAVKPDSRKFEVAWDAKNCRLKASVTEKPERGSANRQLVDGLSKLLDAQVEILRGKTGRRKLLRISLTPDEIRQKVQAQQTGSGRM